MSDCFRDSSHARSDGSATPCATRSAPSSEEAARQAARHVRIAERRELTVHGDHWSDVLAVERATVSELLSMVGDDAWLASLDKHTDPSASVDVLVADEAVSLWLGETRLAVLPWEAMR